jgi:zinc transport system substrate-binding protein
MQFKQPTLFKTLVIIIAIFFFSCDSKNRKNEDTGQKVITVSILPQKTFIEKIAGDDFKVNVLLPPGASPADFTLLPSQLKDIAQSEIWFRIGYIGFEYSWKEKIEQANQNMKVVDLSVGLNLITSEPLMPGEPNPPRGVNPHIWMSPPLVKQMARRITDEISILNPEKMAVYNANYQKFAKETDQLDQKIRNALKDYQSHSFIMFHPSLAYFAREYGLKEHSLEPGGKEPTPQRMTELIQLAREEDIRVIYIQSDLDREQARVFAEEINGEIIEMWPLNPEWEKNLMEITNVLIQNFK